MASTSSSSGSLDTQSNPAGSVTLTAPDPPAPPSWVYAPAAASSAVETSGTFPARNAPRASLESSEVEVEVYELYNLGFADGFISLAIEVVVYGLDDLILVNYAVAVGVIAIFQALL